MNKTKEQLAEEYANKYFEHSHQDKAYLAGFEAAEPKWISVKERQPEESAYVLGANVGDQFICRYIKEKGQFIALGVDIVARADYSVTHWMPLPSPPKQ